MLLILPVPLVLVALAVAVPAALLAAMSVVSGVRMRGFRFGRWLGGLLCGDGADAECRGGRGTEGKVAKCFHLDLL